MSNFLAVATVTSALRHLLLEWVQNDVPGIDVTTARPDAQGGAGMPGRGVNVYLYRVAPNPQLRNFNRPDRSDNGLLTALPQLALNLHYLLSFYGDEDLLEPQRVLGSAATALHTIPVLTAERITQLLTGANPPQFLNGSDLADQVESVKLTPSDLSLEDLSKLWSVFFQTPYVLSMAFEASVVLINPRLTPAPSLPVRQYQLGVIPMAEPVITSVVAQAGDTVPITPGSDARVRGQALRRDPPSTVEVLVGGEVVIPAETRDTRLDLALPAGLAAGVQSLLVRHSFAIGTSGPRAGISSNLAPFVLHPVIDQDAGGHRVTVSNVQGTGSAPRSADITV
jgi:Pvc16 N-terminal domain